MSVQTTLKLSFAFLIFLTAVAFPAAAQNPKLAPRDLEFSQEVAAHNHLKAGVSLEVENGKYVYYSLDRYSDGRQITMADGVAYVQLSGKPWLKSKDWGKTGSKVDKATAEDMEMFASLVEQVMEKSVHRDQSQGGTVWKLLKANTKSDPQQFTYEESRQKPRPNGFYPRYTFMKYKRDKDGKLLLWRFDGQFHLKGSTVPTKIQFDYLFIIPAKMVELK